MPQKVKVVRREGRPYGISELLSAGGSLWAIVHSESGASLLHEMTQAEYDGLTEEGELR